MFGRIAGRYDLANTLLSLGRDAAWRRRAAAATGLRPGQAALDVACGTGRLTRELARRVAPGGRAVGVDFSDEMLQVAKRDHPDLEFQQADALALPFPDATFDASTMAFGLRNLVDPVLGAGEMARVVRPGGTLLVLEFLRPPAGAAGRAYRLYLERGLPLAGGWITGDRRAYQYLADTVETHLAADELREVAASAGWAAPTVARLNLGTVALMVGRAGPQ